MDDDQVTTDDPVVRRTHPWNTGFEWSDRNGPYSTITDEQAAASSTSSATSCSRTRSTRRRSPTLDAELAPGDAAGATSSSPALPDGRFGVAGLDTQTVAPHAVGTLRLVARQFSATPVLAGVARDLDRSRRAALLGSVGLQAAEQRRAGALAPGQRLHLRRAAGVPHVLDRDHRRDARQRLRLGDARRASRGHARAPLDADRRGVLGRLVDARSRCRSGPAASSCSARSRRTRRGRTRTDEVRKAYIVQYVPDGAVALDGDPSSGPGNPRPLVDEVLHRPTVVDGRPVPA